jgi:hypothetical protein
MNDVNFTKIKKVLESVKMHDKDLFMINNILDQLRDKIQDSAEKLRVSAHHNGYKVRTISRELKEL